MLGVITLIKIRMGEMDAATTEVMETTKTETSEMDTAVMTTKMDEMVTIRDTETKDITPEETSVTEVKETGTIIRATETTVITETTAITATTVTTGTIATTEATKSANTAQERDIRMKAVGHYRG